MVKMAIGKSVKGACIAACASLVSFAGSANAADIIDPTPVAFQEPAVDGLNFKAGVVGGSLDGNSIAMFIGSVAAPIPNYENFGIQIDAGIGDYDGGFTAAAAAIHLFWRDPGKGLLGVYADWGYIDNEHGGRIGFEGAIYKDRWSLDVFAGVQFGQHFETEFVDEVDLSYYFTDNFRASIGHRLISRGHVANLSVEIASEDPAYAGWSLYGEIETGEDDYSGGYAGIRYAFGTNGTKSLIDRDRKADPIVRIPRNLASLTRCGKIGDPANYFTSWNGFETQESDFLCGSEADLAARGAVEQKLNDD